MWAAAQAMLDQGHEFAFMKRDREAREKQEAKEKEEQATKEEPRTRYSVLSSEEDFVVYEGK